MTTEQNLNRSPYAVVRRWASAGALIAGAALLGACASKRPAPPATTAPPAATGTAAVPTAGTPAAAGAPLNPAPAAAPSVVEPQVARRDLKLPSYPSRDFEIGLFTGTYTVQNFSTESVSGLRLGYHITEDFFVIGQYGQSKIDDEVFRRFGLGNVLNNPDRKLKYYTLAMGYNMLPGEVFFGRGTAKLSQGYILAGAGTTEFAGQKKQTIDVGFGLRLLWNQRLAFNAEVRDHIYSVDLLGQRTSTNNPEIALGFSVIF